MFDWQNGAILAFFPMFLIFGVKRLIQLIIRLRIFLTAFVLIAIGLIPYFITNADGPEISKGVGAECIGAGLVMLFSWLLLEWIQQFQIERKRGQDYAEFCNAIESAKLDVVIFTTYTYLLLKPKPVDQQLDNAVEGYFDQFKASFDKLLSDVGVHNISIPRKMPEVKILLIHPLSPGAQARIQERFVPSHEEGIHGGEDVANSMRENFYRAYDLQCAYKRRWPAFSVKFYESLPRVSYFRVDKKYARFSFFPFKKPQSDAPALELGESSKVLDFINKSFEEVWKESYDLSLYMHVKCNVFSKDKLAHHESSDNVKYIFRDIEDACLYLFSEKNTSMFWQDVPKAIDSNWSLEISQLTRLFALCGDRGVDKINVSKDSPQGTIMRADISAAIPDDLLFPLDQNKGLTLGDLYLRKYGVEPPNEYCYKIRLSAKRRILFHHLSPNSAEIIKK